MDEDLVNYHLKELRYCAQCLTEDEDFVKGLRSTYISSLYKFEVTWLVQGIRHKVGFFYFSIKLVMISFLQQYIKPTDLKNHFMYMHHSRGSFYGLFIPYLLITKRGRDVGVAWYGLRGRQRLFHSW